MALDGLHTVDIIETMEKFLEQVRPPEEIRAQLDVNYSIDAQSIVINEVRPRWDNKDEYREYGIAKATYNRSKNEWKIFWKRADLKWHGYTPELTVKTLVEFLRVVKEDKHHCFWG
jgi:hypothetical protein